VFEVDYAGMSSEDGCHYASQIFSYRLGNIGQIYVPYFVVCHFKIIKKLAKSKKKIKKNKKK
jgi:hypothetical protein